MPVNNWIPVAQQFGQFLGEQSERKRKLRQRSMMQMLPGYVAGELSNVKTQEDVYKKLPELSARMFAIDPEIGATATQLANSYGQMKLNQIREGEEEESARKNIQIMKDSFGSIPIYHKGKSVLLAEVLDEISSGMKPYDVVKYGEQLLKAATIEKKQALMFQEGKPVMKTYQTGPGGEPVGESKMYNITKMGGLDDPLTKDIENLPMTDEGMKQYQQWSIGEEQSKRSLSRSIALADYQKKLQLETPKITGWSNPKTGETGMGTMQIVDGNLVMKDAEGKVLPKEVINKFYKDQVNPVTRWTDYRKIAGDKAGELLTKFKEAGLLTENRVKNALGPDAAKQYKNNAFDISKVAYADQLMNAFATSSEGYGPGYTHRIVDEIIAGLEDKRGRKLSRKEHDDIYNLWKEFESANQLRDEAQAEVMQLQDMLKSQQGVQQNVPGKVGSIFD